MFRVGDTVMVVRAVGCCGVEGNMGLVFQIAKMDAWPSHCEICGKHANEIVAWADEEHKVGFRLYQLKKFDQPIDMREVSEIVELERWSQC